MPGRLTPQERMRLAKDLMRRANGQPGLKARERQNLRQHASNLLKLNEHQAKMARASAR